MNNSISHYQICIWKLAFHGNRIILALVCSFSEHAVLDTVLGNTKRTRRLSLAVQAWPGLTRTETEVKRNETWWWCLCEATSWSCPHGTVLSLLVWMAGYSLQLQAEWYFYTFMFMWLVSKEPNLLGIWGKIWGPVFAYLMLRAVQLLG